MSELWIPRGDDRYFASPSLIIHYIAEHRYLPPPYYLLAVTAVDVSKRFIAYEVDDALCAQPPEQPTEPIFGARADVAIQFDGRIEELMATLMSGLGFPAFTFSSSEPPSSPNHKVAKTECMGWSITLNRSPESPWSFFRLCLETTSCEHAIPVERMHDLAPWLARTLSDRCGLLAWPA